MICEEKITIEVEGSEVTCNVEFDYIPAVKGVYFAAPEDCYPDEDEEIIPFKLESIECECDLSSLLNIKEINDSVIERIEELKEEV